MKKLIALLLVLTMMLTLTGCKNKAVKNAEELIASIGEVTLDSGEAITAARTAYDALTEKEVVKVENYALLTEAEATFTALEEEYTAVCEWLVGEWVSLNDILNRNESNTTLSFSEDFTVIINEDKTTWAIGENVIDLENDLLTPKEENDIVLMERADGGILIRQDDLEQVFVSVELTNDNINDYLEIIDMPFQEVDGFGEVISEGNHIWCRSKAFDQGLLYLCGNDVLIELERQSGPFGTATKEMPYGSVNIWEEAGSQDSPSRPIWEYANNFSIGRVKGTVRFVRAEYADVSVLDGERCLTVFGVTDFPDSKTPIHSNSRFVPMDEELCKY